MFCSRCGTSNPDGSAFCSSCGAPLSQQNPAPADSQPVYQQVSPAPYGGAAPGGQAPIPYAPAPDLPMNWYKFLIWVSLFLGALLNAGAGVRALLGLQYGDTSVYVYALFGGLRVIDILYGVLLLGLAAAGIFVRQELAHFKKDGPLHYLILIGASTVLAVAYLILVSLVTGMGVGDLVDVSTVSSLGTNIVMLVANKVYFDKRQHLFTA